MTRATMTRAKAEAVQVLAALPSDSWQLLQELARANTSGRLGLAAWAERAARSWRRAETLRRRGAAILCGSMTPAGV